MTLRVGRIPYINCYPVYGGIDRGVVALDAESTVETVADGMAPHPTLAEAIKEAGLVALGRPIHVATRRKAPTGA